jgi:ribosomal protein S18 acetylase RimI-like enzyme
MSISTLRDTGWSLAAASDADIRQIMRWFPDEDSVGIWGGPEFRFPFTAETFREDCRLERLDSYSLRNEEGELAAFGQSYERDARGHLARLVANPLLRRRGAGSRLIRMIIASLGERYDYEEYSLFVMRDNVPAYRCYRSLGFVVRDCPDGVRLADKCLFLTRQRRE